VEEEMLRSAERLPFDANPRGYCLEFTLVKTVFSLTSSPWGYCFVLTVFSTAEQYGVPSFVGNTRSPSATSDWPAASAMQQPAPSNEATMEMPPF
jgi:hypothetical protein